MLNYNTILVAALSSKAIDNYHPAAISRTTQHYYRPKPPAETPVLLNVERR
ncbi:hypothetical protein QUA62_15050 [Microcoleus sp. MON1_C1]|uniref:hypothetical protein n=1 Tax=Microcoleus sp. MON1_C1 TaxID=2818827 RepID=UPI002FD2B6AD